MTIIKNIINSAKKTWRGEEDPVKVFYTWGLIIYALLPVFIFVFVKQLNPFGEKYEFYLLASIFGIFLPILVLYFFDKKIKNLISGIKEVLKITFYTLTSIKVIISGLFKPFLGYPGLLQMLSLVVLNFYLKKYTTISRAQQEIIVFLLYLLFLFAWFTIPIILINIL
jgi:hypothetical protein